MGVGGVIKKIAPAISTILGLAGTATGQPLLGMAARTLSQLTGTEVKPEPAAMEDALKTLPPDKYLELKQLDADLQVKMRELGIGEVKDLEEIAATDRQSARSREIAVRDKTPRNLAYLVVSLAVGMEGYGLLHGFSPHVDGVVLGRILGTLDSALIIVLSYYFGSSFGSSRKTDVLAQLGGKDVVVGDQRSGV